MDLDGLVIHNPVNLSTRSKIETEFGDVWYKKISFWENFESQEFSLAADLIFIAVKYITGMAALVSRDPSLALLLHESIQRDLKKFDTLPPNLCKIKTQLNNLIAEESLLIARWHYSQGNFDESNKDLEQSKKALPENYQAFLLEAVQVFQKEKNAEKALALIYKSKRYAKEDGTWRYNEGFLQFPCSQHSKTLLL